MSKSDLYIDGEYMNTKTTPFPRRSFIASAAALGVVALINPSKAFAEDAASVQAEADSAASSLKSMQSNLDKASNDYTQALMDQQQAQDNMDAAQQQIDQQNQQIADLQSKLGTRARSMYRTGGNSMLDVIFGSVTFQELATNWDILSTMNDQDAQLVDETKTAREQLEAAKQEYSQQEQVAAQKADEAGQKKAQAESLVAQQQALYNSLSAQVVQKLQEERAAQEAAAAAQVAAVVAATPQSTGGSSTPSDSNTGSSDTGAGTGGSDTGGYSSGGGNVPSYDGGGDAVSRAGRCIGAPYATGGVGPGSYDCSGFVSYCLTGEHIRLGTTYTFMGWPQVSLSEAQPGDVLVNDDHCGLYIGNGMMIDAQYAGVTAESIHGWFQWDRIVRYPG